VPLACSEERLLFGDMRFKADNNGNREGNAGIGIRQMKTGGILGGYAMFDRLRSGETDKLHSQMTFGAEWLAEEWEVRSNIYTPLSGEKEVATGTPAGAAIGNPFLSGGGIFVPVAGEQVIREKPLLGMDLEAGFKLPGQNFWLHSGAFTFGPDRSQGITGGRVRAHYDITEYIALTAEGQYDNKRGQQGWLGIRLRVPFGKTEKPDTGLKARMTAAPVRDVDVVTGAQVTKTSPDTATPVVNTATGVQQRILYVDNMAAPGGSGTKEAPFNTLADAETAMQPYDMIYVQAGDGTTAGQDQGITLNQIGVRLIGSGTDFIYNGGHFTHASGTGFKDFILAPATSAPVITNTGADGDGIIITADNIDVVGVTVDGASRDGIVIRANGMGASAQNVAIQNVNATNNRMGIFIHGTNDGAISAHIEGATTTANTQHGIAVYDDTDSLFEVDLGGGALGSSGNNVLTGNGLEDLAVDYDGRTLSVRNNWWGQASGPDADTPDIGITPQIYYGAPINDGLAGHWTFDTEWTTDTTAYDRSGQGNNGTLTGGLSLANQVAGQNREALDFDGINHLITYGNPASLLIDNNISIISKIQTLSTKTESTIFAESGAIVVRDYQLYLRNGEIVFRHANATETVSSGKLSGLTGANNNFSRQVAFTAEGLDATFYLDNEQASLPLDFQVNATPTNTSRRTSISAAFPNSMWEGKLDDIRIYNRALPASEIAELYRMNTSSIVDVGSFLTVAP